MKLIEVTKARFEWRLAFFFTLALFQLQDGQ
jgi:hypothetical protein